MDTTLTTPCGRASCAAKPCDYCTAMGMPEVQAALAVRSTAVEVVEGELQEKPTGTDLRIRPEWQRLAASALVDYRAGLLEQVSEISGMVQALETAIVAKMQAEDATTVYHAEYDVEYKPTVAYDKNDALLYQELTALAEAGKCDPKVVAKAVQRELPTEPVYSSNRTHLKTLEKLGGEVAAAIARNVRTIEGPSKLVIKAKKK